MAVRLVTRPVGQTKRWGAALVAAAAVCCVLALPSPAHAVSYPVKCSSVRVSGASFNRVSVTTFITCSWGRTVLRRWSARGYTRRGVSDGRGNTWFCDFTGNLGGSSRRGDCTAGKNGGVAFTLTYR